MQLNVQFGTYKQSQDTYSVYKMHKVKKKSNKIYMLS